MSNENGGAVMDIEVNEDINLRTEDGLQTRGPEPGPSEPSSSSLALVLTTNNSNINATSANNANSTNSTNPNPINTQPHQHPHHPSPASNKRSWVWAYFVECPDRKLLKCTVPMVSGEMCGRLLKRDKSGSTKSMHEHLMSLHKLGNPQKRIKNPTPLEKFLASAPRRALSNSHPPTASIINGTGSVTNRLNPESLKSAIVYMICDCELPLEVVDSKSFKSLLEYCNPQALNVMPTKKDHLIKHLQKTHATHQQHIKQKYLTNTKWVAYTVEAWTSPNITGFMSVTAHFLTEEYEMVNLLLGIPHIQGEYSGADFGELFCGVLHDFGGGHSLLTITADDPSTTNSMALTIESRTGGGFVANKRLIGCVGHVLNLAALDLLAVFGYHIQEETELNLEGMDLGNLVGRSVGIELELRTVDQRLHGLVAYVQSSVETSEQFQKLAVPIGQKPDESHSLILDDRKCWSSAFKMLERAFDLRDACDRFCDLPGTNHFKLTHSEWEKIGQMIDLLKPLNGATDMLRSSTYPTVNTTLPLCISLINKLTIVRVKYHHASRFMPEAEQVIRNLEQYLVTALKKPALICATILDPRLKMYFFQAQRISLEKYGVSPDYLKATFVEHAQAFDDRSNRFLPGNEKSSLSPFDDDIFGAINDQSSLDYELNRYFSEATEPKQTDILTYWKSRIVSYPCLASMARCYLAVPATSSSTDRIFQQPQKVLGDHRVNLEPDVVEQVLCIKEWYRLFGPIYPKGEIMSHQPLLVAD